MRSSGVPTSGQSFWLSGISSNTAMRGTSARIGVQDCPASTVCELQ